MGFSTRRRRKKFMTIWGFTLQQSPPPHGPTFWAKFSDPRVGPLRGDCKNFFSLPGFLGRPSGGSPDPRVGPLGGDSTSVHGGGLYCRRYFGFFLSSFFPYWDLDDELDEVEEDNEEEDDEVEEDDETPEPTPTPTSILFLKFTTEKTNFLSLFF